MDAYTYVNMFATKGIEYLLVIGFLILFVFFWRYMNRPARPPARSEPAGHSDLPRQGREP